MNCSVLHAALLMIFTLAATAEGVKIINYRIRLVRVKDGDTIVAELIDRGGAAISIRMQYIDAPETKQSYGPEATTFLKNLLNKKKIGIDDLVLSNTGTDKYGRSLGVLRLRNRDVNKDMVANGYAWCYRNKCPKYYKTALKTAQSKHLGLWQDSKPQSPWDYRKRMKESKKSPSPNRHPTEPVTTIRSQFRPIRTVDGDTVVGYLANQGDKLTRVRLVYIDAPEMSQRHGKEAAKHLNSIIFSRRGNSDISLTSHGMDKYGRELGVIQLGNKTANEMMVARGYAWCYRDTCPSSYRVMMKEARLSRLGLWEDKSPESPWDYRKRMRGE